MSVQATKSREKWRERGFYVETVEHFVPPGRYSDLFGFVDLLAVPADNRPWVYIQSTSRGHISTRKRKILSKTTGSGQHAKRMKELAEAILMRGDRIVIEGWDQPKGPGTAWRCKEVDLLLGDLR